MNPDNPSQIIDDFLSTYEQAYDHYEIVASRCRNHCETLLESAGIRAIFSARAKHPTRLREKLYKRHATKKPYTCIADIQSDIVDFAGVRIALYFPGDQERVRTLIEANFDVLNTKSDFAPVSTPIYKKEFSGYNAVHYHVRLREEQVEDPRFVKPRIEIQVASVLMHAWAEVEHDLIYKPGDVALSKDEHAALDEINGLVKAGEITLSRLQEAINKRASQPKTPFADHYELAMYLRRAIEPSLAGDANAIIMGRVDILLRFLQLAELDRPYRLDQFATDIDPDTNTASVVEQVVDRIIEGRLDLEDKYREAREEVGARNPYSSTSEHFVKPDEATSYGNFFLRWSAFENFVTLLAQTKGFDASAVGPSQVVDRLRRLNIVDAETLNKINDIRKLRIQAVHGSTLVDLTELNLAAGFLDHFMHASQFRLLEGIEEIAQQANVASATDGLTGLGNRRVFGLRVAHEFRLNPEQNVSLLMLDVDHFKQFNDRYGHVEGDKLIKAIADVLRANADASDVIARYGGEEFVVLLFNAGKEEAIIKAEHYRQAVEALSFEVNGVSIFTKVTVSVGVSTVIPKQTNWMQFINEADVALYRAKGAGRNRVVHSQDAQ